MSEPLLRQLINVMKVVRFREERVLIKQGAENAFCYIIIRGSVSVYVDGKFLYKLRRTGDVFGEISFATQSISTATIKAEKDLGVMVISYNFFNKIKSVELALWLARVIGEKLIRTSKIKSEETQLSDAARAFKAETLQTNEDSSDAEETGNELFTESVTEGAEQIELPTAENEQTNEADHLSIEPESEPESDDLGEDFQSSEETAVSENSEIDTQEPSADQDSIFIDSEGPGSGPSSEEIIDLDME